jgi:hypothetical protein
MSKENSVLFKNKREYTTIINENFGDKRDEVQDDGVYKGPIV